VLIDSRICVLKVCVACSSERIFNSRKVVTRANIQYRYINKELHNFAQTRSENGFVYVYLLPNVNMNIEFQASSGPEFFCSTILLSDRCVVNQDDDDGSRSVGIASMGNTRLLKFVLAKSHMSGFDDLNKLHRLQALVLFRHYSLPLMKYDTVRYWNTQHMLKSDEQIASLVCRTPSETQLYWLKLGFCFVDNY